MCVCWLDQSAAFMHTCTGGVFFLKHGALPMASALSPERPGQEGTHLRGGVDKVYSSASIGR